MQGPSHSGTALRPRTVALTGVLPGAQAAQEGVTCAVASAPHGSKKRGEKKWSPAELKALMASLSLPEVCAVTCVPGKQPQVTQQSYAGDRLGTVAVQPILAPPDQLHALSRDFFLDTPLFLCSLTLLPAP